MKPYTYSKEKSEPFFQKYQNQILAFILAIFSLPVGFAYTVNTSLDGSWVRALNMAIKNNLVFGRDIVFTYGPLAYFSTRNTQYIHDIYLFTADVFLCACFYYVSLQLISKYKGWFIILFVAEFYFKGYEYAASLFLFFIVFTILNLKNNFNNYFEIIACGICGVVVFFVKVNYGLVALPIMIFIAILSLIRNRKSFLIFLGTVSVVFTVIYTHVNVDIANFIRYSLPMISCYNEAMQITIKSSDSPFISVVIYFVIFFIAILFYYWQKREKKSPLLVQLSTILLLTLMLFLAYKNGFTRADGHTQGFFTLLPLFTVFAIFLFDLAEYKSAKIACILIIFMSDLNVDLPHGSEGMGFINRVTVFHTYNYFKTAFKKLDEIPVNELKIPDDKLQLVGKSTIDIFPIDIAIMQLNNMNYFPRPIMQTYSAYSPVLDSLNAAHFYKNNRPEFAMLKMGYIDNRYVAWDEPLTHAMLRLNYKYVDYISLNKDTALVNSDASYMLLKSIPGVQKYPKFEKIQETTINFEDTVHFDFKDDTPIYMSVDIQPTVMGKLKSIIYQAPVLYVSLFLNHECTSSLRYEAIKPIIKAPVLISNFIVDNLDYREFMNGNSQKNAKVKAFSFHSDGWGYEKKIKLTFYKFSNY